MTIKSLLSATAAAPATLRRIAATKKANFKKGIQSKENFMEYIRTPGSKDDPKGSKWSWSNEGMHCDAPFLLSKWLFCTSDMRRSAPYSSRETLLELFDLHFPLF